MPRHWSCQSRCRTSYPAVSKSSSSVFSHQIKALAILDNGMHMGYKNVYTRQPCQTDVTVGACKTS